MAYLLHISAKIVNSDKTYIADYYVGRFNETTLRDEFPDSIQSFMNENRQFFEILQVSLNLVNFH